MNQLVSVTRPQPGVSRIVIDSPPANALGASALAQLDDALDEADRDEALRVVLLEGRSGAFCAGADIRGLSGQASRGDFENRFLAVLDKIEGLRVPVVAVIDGHCIGGGFELALACDIRIAGPGAYFIAAGVNIGLVASVFRLSRLIGPGRAAPILMSGAKIDAGSALAHGIVTEFHETGLAEAAMALAERIATRAPLSVEAVKRLLRLNDGQPSAAFDNQFYKEFAALSASEDHREAVRAFLTRDKPVFKHR